MGSSVGVTPRGYPVMNLPGRHRRLPLRNPPVWRGNFSPSLRHSCIGNPLCLPGS